MPDMRPSDFSNIYDNTFKPWAEFLIPWNKITEEKSPFLSMEKLNSFARDYRENMSKLNEMMSNNTKMFSPFSSGNGNKISGVISNSTKMYNAWLKNTNSAAKKVLEVGRKTVSGQEVDIEEFFETLKNSYDEMMACTSECLEETPFKGIKAIEQITKKFVDSFSKDQQKVTSIYKELFEFNTKMINFSVSFRKESTNIFADILKQGAISDETYKHLIEAYGKILKHSISALCLSRMLPNQEKILDNTIHIAEKHVDMLLSRLESYFVSYQSMKAANEEIYKFIRENIQQGKISPQSQIFEKWAEACGNAMEKLIENPRFYDTIPEFIDTCAEYMRLTNQLCNTLMTSSTNKDREEESKNDDMTFTSSLSPLSANASEQRVEELEETNAATMNKVEELEEAEAAN